MVENVEMVFVVKVGKVDLADVYDEDTVNTFTDNAKGKFYKGARVVLCNGEVFVFVDFVVGFD